MIVIYSPDAIKSKLLEAFTEQQATLLSEMVYNSYHDLVKISDFNELKSIVKDIAEVEKRTAVRMDELTEAQKQTEKRMDEMVGAQKELAGAQKNTESALKELATAQKQTEKRMDEMADAQKELAGAQKNTESALKELATAQKQTEKRMDEMADAQKELAGAQKNTESALKELATAQKQTEKRMDELAEAQKNTESALKKLAEAQKQTEIEVRSLAIGLKETRGDLGGLTRTLGYAFENEAYRMAPKVLRERYGIELKEKLIRAYVQNKEVNLLGKGIRDGKEVWIVGESKMRLDARRYREQEDIFGELEEKVKAVQSEYGEVNTVRVLITHFAAPSMIKEAQQRGIIVLQSFEW